MTTQVIFLYNTDFLTHRWKEASI